jgi:hypothetical protein
MVLEMFLLLRKFFMLKHVTLGHTGFMYHITEGENKLNTSTTVLLDTFTITKSMQFGQQCPQWGMWRT